MFSSNQIFKVTGPLNQIINVIKCAFILDGQDKHLSEHERERGCKTVYQISEDGRYYCLGWGFEEVPPGWKEYDKPFTYHRASEAVKEFITNRMEICNKENFKDCIVELGFLAENIKGEIDNKGIKTPYHGIIKFSAYPIIYMG